MPRVKSKNLVFLSINLLKRDVRVAKKIAEKRGIPYQHVIRAWVTHGAEAKI